MSILLLGGEVLIAGEPRVWNGIEPSGKSRPVVLVCPADGQPVIKSRDRDAPTALGSYRRLEVPPEAQVYIPRGGDRWVRLLSGETCPIEMTKYSPQGVMGTPVGGATVTLPWGVIAAVSQPLTETELQLLTAEPGNHLGPLPLPTLPGPAWSGQHSFVVPSPADTTLLTSTADGPEGGVTLSWLDAGVDSSESTPTKSASTEWSLDFVFAQGESSVTLAITPGGIAAGIRAQAQGDWSLETHDIPHRPGWRHLRVQWNPRRLVALVDNQILATGNSPGLPWQELRVRRNQDPSAQKRTPGEDGPGEEPGASTPEIRLDDLRVFRSAAPQSIPDRHVEGPGLWLSAGDVVYRPGIVDQYLNGKPWDAGLPQPEAGLVRGVIPRWTNDIPPATPLAGWWVRLDWQPRFGERLEEPGGLSGVLQEVTESDVVVRHPWLGRLSIPLPLVERVTPLWLGRRREIDPSTRHLGNNTRTGWRIATPEGTIRKWSVDLTGDDLQGSAPVVALTVHELEPSGGDWARQGAFHEELAKGGLLTELWINNQRVTDLNRWLDRPATADNPARLRIPIDPGLVKVGVNSLELRQTPAVQSKTEFDDIEFWDLAWEQPADNKSVPRQPPGTPSPKR